MFRTLVAFALAAFVATAVTAAPTSSVRIRGGETLVLRISGQKVEILDRQVAGALSAFEAFALRQTQGIVIPPELDKVPAIPIAGDAPGPIIMIPNQVRLTFREVAGSSVLDPHAFLMIENGYVQSFRFKAVMHGGSKTSATDVCEVFGGVPGIEHWPFHIEWLELSDLRLDERIGSQPRCQ